MATAVRIEQPGHHALSFSAEDLEAGFGECLACGERMDLEAWMVLRCRGRRAAPIYVGPEPVTPR